MALCVDVRYSSFTADYPFPHLEIPLETNCVKWRNNSGFRRQCKLDCEGSATVLLSCCIHERNAEWFCL